MSIFYNECAKLREAGVSITPDNLKISSRAIICLPYHKLQDIMEEERLADKKFGSTRRGIAPVYADKYMKKALRMEDLFHMDSLYEKLRDIVEWKNITVTGYKHEAVNVDELMDWIKTYGSAALPYICDVPEYLSAAAESGRSIMFEAQLGALRDIDFGIYPYTSSSNTSRCLRAHRRRCSGLKLDETIGIMKAYSSCVGEGPFTVELFGEEGEKPARPALSTARPRADPRRVGPVDIPASRYGVRVQGADYIALTKMDVLSIYDKVPVCVAYDVDGEITKSFPTGERLNRAKPVIEYLPGFGGISACRKPEELPAAAREYISFIEKEIGCPIKYVSVGAERDEYIQMF